MCGWLRPVEPAQRPRIACGNVVVLQGRVSGDACTTGEQTGPMFAFVGRRGAGARGHTSIPGNARAGMNDKYPVKTGVVVFVFVFARAND